MYNSIYGPFMDIYVILPSEKSDYSVVEKKVVRMPSDLSDYSVVLKNQLLKLLELSFLFGTLLDIEG